MLQEDEAVSIIKIVNLTKEYGEITALDHLNLSIEDGEYLCVLGQTGAGKTTLLRIIAGLTDPNEGEIYIKEKKVNMISPEKRSAVYMFQQFALFPHMNVWENVSFGPSIKNWDDKSVKIISSEVLEMVRLADRQGALPNELSGGMQQRVALARGIASGARILLLDEPLGALDARLRVDLRTQLRRLVKEQKLTAIHVTHDQEEALMTADRVVILRSGRIEQIGTPNEVYLRPQSIFVASFVGGANFIEGNVIKFDDSNSIIGTRGDLRIQVERTGIDVGERVVIAVRLEDVSISSAEVTGFNNFSGKIESGSFIGCFMKYNIRLTNDIAISSKILLSNVSKIYKTGEKVVISFPPERCHLFAYPKIGLLKEIEAI